MSGFNSRSQLAGRLVVAAALVSCTMLSVSTSARAYVEYQKVFMTEYIAEHTDKDFAKFVKRKARCYICHQGKGHKHDNIYGAHLAKLLDCKKDKKDVEKITKAIRKVADLPFDPKNKKSETFAERIAASKLPAGELEDLKKKPPGEEVVEEVGGK